jgi:hypothetical protein
MGIIFFRLLLQDRFHPLVQPYPRGKQPDHFMYRSLAIYVLLGAIEQHMSYNSHKLQQKYEYDTHVRVDSTDSYTR